jgi:hypothetical protein
VTGAYRCSFRANGIVRSIDKQVSHINDKRNRGKGKRLLESKEDIEEVNKRYQQIEKLFRQLQVGNLVCGITQLLMCAQTDISLRTLHNTSKQLMVRQR